MASASRIVVPISGQSSDAFTVELACLLAKQDRSSIEPIYVIEVSRDLPIDAELQEEIDRGEDLLADAEKQIRAAGIPCETSLLQARDVGAAIVDEAMQAGADTIVMGLTYKKRFGEYEIGPCASYVLKNAPCRVVVMRQPQTL
ncbi:MAG: universal stress protein [Chloroflexi bacterium]|nr:universal stress protein [Chloroflexota bacterium]